MKKLKLIVLVFIVASICSCKQSNSAEKDKVDMETNLAQSKKEMLTIMQKHLDAVTNKDIGTLKSTLSPNGNMQLIVPGTEMMSTVPEFVEYHSGWFQDTTWSFETKIVNSNVDNSSGFVTTQIVYREPERDGKPYFNRMYVTYGLEKINDQWYIVSDHASSVEKSTDQKPE